jgi:hypothetical protein
VLLLEAGGWDRNPLIHIPLAALGASSYTYAEATWNAAQIVTVRSTS